MVMKDKLVKTNHKASYYVTKKISIIALAIVCGAFAIAVPTYIIQNSQKKSNALAEENTTEVQEQDNSAQEEEINEYLHY